MSTDKNIAINVTVKIRGYGEPVSEEETIEFFRKLLTKTEWNLRYAEGMGRTKDAENIRKKVEYYRMAIEALERMKENG